MCNVVAYYRVSTETQGRSGLGLEAQREAVRQLCDQRDWKVISEFTEIESGKNAKRPELTEALHRASSEVGFIYVRNHGIDPALIDAAQQSAFQF